MAVSAGPPTVESAVQEMLRHLEWLRLRAADVYQPNTANEVPDFSPDEDSECEIRAEACVCGVDDVPVTHA
jgi:hypothetical protein